MKVIASVALAVCLAMPVAASAGVIDFEDLPHLAYFEFSSQLSHGYLISHGGSKTDPFAEVVGPGGPEAFNYSGNGSKRLVAFNTSSITVSRADGGAFDLLQFDGGESWLDLPHGWARQIAVVGQLAAGGSVAQIFTLDLHKDALTGMQQFILDEGFRDLLSVRFAGLGNLETFGAEFSLDNLLVQPDAVALPQPGSAWLLGAGMAVLALGRRRISSAAGAR